MWQGHGVKVHVLTRGGLTDMESKKKKKKTNQGLNKIYSEKSAEAIVLYEKCRKG